MFLDSTEANNLGGNRERMSLSRIEADKLMSLENLQSRAYFNVPRAFGSF